MAFDLDSAARARVLEFVRPLSVGLDGMTNFGFVERRLAVAGRLLGATRALRPDGAASEGRLFLLTCFAGLSQRRVAPGGRTELLLASAGVPTEEVQALHRSLRRFETDPKNLEEELVHDAVLLETVGAYGVTQALVAGTRERMTLREMAEEIERKMSAVTFVTEAARELARSRIEFARDFARKLREEVLEFEPAVGQAIDRPASTATT